VLSNDEIRFATESQAGPLLRFLLLAGLWIGEAYNGHREGQYWVVPANASKDQREHRVRLSELALVQLEQHPWAPRRFFVHHWVSANAGGCSCHDLRRTFSTRLNGMGVAPHVVERMLNHTFPGVMGV
jgi:integrase